MAAKKTAKPPFLKGKPDPEEKFAEAKKGKKGAFGKKGAKK